MPTDSRLETRIASVGRELANKIGSVLDAIPGGPHGPAQLARTIGIDKVLASRVLKATRNRDPMAVLHLAPGPDPLRRLLRAARKGAVSAELVSEAEQAVQLFEILIRQEAGDLSALHAMISAWLPDARAEFELRRKQAAFRAMSQLLGVAMHTHLASLVVRPSPDGVHLDIAILGIYLRLQRLRAGGIAKFMTVRLPKQGAPPRMPRTLRGVPVEDVDGLLLAEFCSKPMAKLGVVHAGEAVHYTLAGDDFGPRSGTDLAFAEVNLADVRHHVPEDPDYKRFLSAEITIPANRLVFDLLLHEDVWPGAAPTLHIYDTSVNGIADLNDRARDIDRLDLCESIQPLGTGISRFRAPDVPRYTELLQHACTELGWEGDRFRGFRCRIEYPIYGSQVMMAFSPSAGS